MSDNEPILEPLNVSERADNASKKYFIETHGCQMNVADSELVETIMDSAGYQ
jgi:hypothetical protein